MAYGCTANIGNTQTFLNDMAKKKKHIEFNTGDEVKLPRKTSSKATPVRVDSAELPQAFPVSFEGVFGQILYNKVYQVSGKRALVLVDNSAKPLPLIAKDFINNPVYSALFKMVRSNSTENEES